MHISGYSRTLEPRRRGCLSTTLRFTRKFAHNGFEQAAFIQQQAARPAAQSTVISMVEVLTQLKQYGTPEMQRYLDLLMIQAVRHQNIDPLSALVAQEWFRRAHNAAGSIP